MPVRLTSSPGSSKLKLLTERHMEQESAILGSKVAPEGQPNQNKTFGNPPSFSASAKSSSLNHDVEKVVIVREYIADLEQKFSRLQRALGVNPVTNLVPRELNQETQYEDQEQHSYVDCDSTRVDDCRIPYFKETVDLYLKDHGSQTKPQVTQEDKESNHQLNHEPSEVGNSKTVGPLQNVESEKSRLQSSILKYHQDHPDCNSIVKVSASNITNCRVESLRMVDLLKHYVGKSEQERIEEMYKRSSLQSVKLRKTALIHIRERNSSAKDLLMTLKSKVTLDRAIADLKDSENHTSAVDPISNYFITVLVYDSVKKKKQAELVCSVNNTFSQLFDSIECPCKFADTETSQAFAPFMSLNEHVISRQNRFHPPQLGLQAILQARKKAGLQTTVWSAETTKLWQVPLNFGQGLIFRDLPRCDHLVLFKDLFKDPGLAQVDPQLLPTQTFYPRLHRQTCEACACSKFARVVVHKDKHSLKELAFYCKECYEDLFLDEGGAKKDPEMVVLPYLYD